MIFSFQIKSDAIEFYCYLVQGESEFSVELLQAWYQDKIKICVNEMWQSGLVWSRLWSKLASQIKTSDTLLSSKPSPL